MGFRKLGLLFLVLFFHSLLLPAYPQSLTNSLSKALTQEQNVGETKKLQAKIESDQHEITVDRRGGGGGGHGGGHGGRGGHGGSGKSGRGHGDATMAVIPLYAAGTMNQHHMYGHHRGANGGSLNYNNIGLNCLALPFLVSMLLNFLYVI